jgi:hypothetical protein
MLHKVRAQSETIALEVAHLERQGRTMLATRHVLIGLPAYNEEIALPRLLARVESLRKSSPEPITVVLYNDGSTDATLATARAWQERVRLVILDGIVNKGLGAGLCALVDYAVANAADGDVLVVMDCDDTHDPEQIEEMLACIAEGADVVIGSRYERGALVRGVPPLRRVRALGAAALFKTIHHVRGVWDYTCGYRAYRVSVAMATSWSWNAVLPAWSSFCSSSTRLGWSLPKFRCSCATTRNRPRPRWASAATSGGCCRCSYTGGCAVSIEPRARWRQVESLSCSRSMMEHDLFGKPVSTHRVKARGHAFPDHALGSHGARRHAIVRGNHRLVDGTGGSVSNRRRRMSSTRR